MQTIHRTKLQMRAFLLQRHGLLGRPRFAGKQGVLDFVKMVGCIQFDPIDICGRNAELVLQSRIKEFSKGMLETLLYQERQLVDFPDKNMSIVLTSDWPCFEHFRQASRQHAQGYPQMQELLEKAYEYIARSGVVGSDDLDMQGDYYWHSAIHWSSGTNLSRSVLEQLYSMGDLIVHHKNGSRKFYDLAKRHIPQPILDAKEPFATEADHVKWQILRRIGAVGAMWNKPSDAWLNIWGLDAAKRTVAFDSLEAEGAITPVIVEGIRQPLYVRTEETEQLLNCGVASAKRCELMAPLDNLLWDRKLIKELFDFEYTWEIYTPKAKRKYGHYVLPMIYGNQFIARAEVLSSPKTQTLTIANLWFEPGIRRTKAMDNAIQKCFERFAAFNECSTITNQIETRA